MTMPNEPLEMLEPDNLLEPMDLTDAQSAGGNSSAPRRRDRIPRTPFADRMLPIGHQEMPRLPPRQRGMRRSLTISLIAVGAAACIGAGAALSELVRNHGATQRHAASGSPGPAEASKTSGPAAGNAGANGQMPQSAGGSPAAAPCDQQAWPNYGHDCLKHSGNAARDPSATRTVSPDRNPDGSSRATPSAVATVPSANALSPANALPPANAPAVANAGGPSADGQAPAAKPVEAEKTAAEPAPSAERRANEEHTRKARRAARLERAHHAAQAAALPPERAADAGDGENARSGEDTERSRQIEPPRRARRSGREGRSRYRDNGYWERDEVREAERRGRDVNFERLDRSRSYRFAPESGRMLVLPGFAPDW